jgi:hypothetical protein
MWVPRMPSRSRSLPQADLETEWVMLATALPTKIVAPMCPSALFSLVITQERSPLGRSRSIRLYLLLTSTGRLHFHPSTHNLQVLKMYLLSQAIEEADALRLSSQACSNSRLLLIQRAKANSICNLLSRFIKSSNFNSNSKSSSNSLKVSLSKTLSTTLSRKQEEQREQEVESTSILSKIWWAQMYHSATIKIPAPPNWPTKILEPQNLTSFSSWANISSLSKLTSMWKQPISWTT